MWGDFPVSNQAFRYSIRLFGNLNVIVNRQNLMLIKQPLQLNSAATRDLQTNLMKNQN